uniref:Uncharacterized protein n=1 Tax=Romanomermis culicivorax TaxID=13658 RepID=A0A915KS01_ROMCU
MSVFWSNKIQYQTAKLRILVPESHCIYGESSKSVIDDLFSLRQWYKVLFADNLLVVGPNKSMPDLREKRWRRIDLCPFK